MAEYNIPTPVTRKEQYLAYIAENGGGGGGGSAVLGTKTITENGVYYASDDGFDGYSRVTVNTPTYELVEKAIVKNGVYDPADDSADGYDKVTVDVPCIIIGTASVEVI